MAKVATAYVEILPDVSKFGAELKAKLKEIGAVKVKVEPDLKAFDTAMKSALAKSAPGMAKQFGDDFNRNLRRRVSDDGERTGRDYGRSFSRGTQRELDDASRRAGDLLKVRMRHAAEDAVEEMIKPFRNSKGKLVKITEEQGRAIERAAASQFGAVGATAARSMVGKFNREAEKGLKNVARTGIRGFLDSFAGGIASGLSGVTNGLSKALANPYVLAAVTAAAVVAAAFVFAFAAAVTAGLAGIGAVAFGAFMQRNDPRVREAASDLGHSFTTAFGEATKPLASKIGLALSTVSGQMSTWAKSVGELFASINLIPLTRGLTGFMTNLTKGFSKIGEVVNAAFAGLGEALPELGRAIGDLFAGMDPSEVRHAMVQLIQVIQHTTEAFGGLMRIGLQAADKLSKGWRNVNSLADAIDRTIHPKSLGDIGHAWGQFWDDFSGKTDAAAQAAADAQKKIDEATSDITQNMSQLFPDATSKQIQAAIDGVAQSMGGAVEDTAVFNEKVAASLAKIKHEADSADWKTFQEHASEAFTSTDAAVRKAVDAVKDLIDQMHILNDDFLAGQAAQRQFEEAIDKATEAIKEGKTGITKFDEAGRENQVTLESMAEAATANWQANLKQKKALKDILPEYEHQIDQIKQTAKNLGMTDAQAKAYIVTLGLTPKNILTQAVVAGVPGAKEALDALTHPRTAEIKPIFDSSGIPDVTNEFKTLGAGAANAFASGAAGSGAPAAAGAATGSQYSAGAANQGGKANQAGKGLTQQTAAGATSGNTANNAGTSVGKQIAQGVGSPPVKVVSQQAGKSLGDQIVNAFKGFNWVELGTNIGNLVAQGLKNAAGPVGTAAGFLAGLVKDVLPHSPAKTGPLSGKGDPRLSGIAISERLAAGMITGVPNVSSAASTVAGAVKFAGPIPNSAALGASQPVLAVRVYIGDRELTDIVRTEIDVENDNTSRLLFAGRRV